MSSPISRHKKAIIEANKDYILRADGPVFQRLLYLLQGNSDELSNEFIKLVGEIENLVENGHDESYILDYLDDEPCEPYTPLSTESSTDSTGYPFELTGWVVKPGQKKEWLKM